MHRHGLLLAGLLAVLPPGGAAGGNLTVSPTRIELGPERTPGVVTLVNNDSTPSLVQVETFAWPRTPATADLEPTRELMAVPPVFELQPGARQVIRVALRAPHAGPAEAAYRLLISEVPRPGDAPGGVRFALRLSLPVFATPPGARAQPEWRIVADPAGSRLEVANTGTAHLQVQRIRLSGAADATIAQPAYVLPGRSQSWPLPVSLMPGSRLDLAADTNLGPLTVPLDVQGG